MLGVWALTPRLFAQTSIFTVQSGTPHSILANTPVGANELVMTPSADFSLSGISLSRSTATSNTSPFITVSRVYKFSSTSNPFTGAITFNYADGAELNSISEATLSLLLHNGSLWNSFAPTTRNGSSNFVQTAALSAVPLNELTLSDVTTWKGTTGGSWNSASNWTDGVPVSTINVLINTPTPQMDVDYSLGANKVLSIGGTGALSIGPGKTLSISGTANFGGKPVTVKSDATGTGAIGQITGTLSGASNVTVERYINTNKRAWRLLTIPVTGQSIRNAWAGAAANGNAPAGEVAGSGTLITGHGYTLGSTATAVGFDWFNGLDSTTTSSIRHYSGGTWASATNTPNILSAPAKQGYLVYVRGDRRVADSTNSSNTTLRPTGALKTGTQTVAIADAYEMVGNPYPANIDLTGVYNNGTNSSVIERNFWLWDATLSTYGAYRSLSWDGASAYTMSGGTGTAADYQKVQSGQAFFVQKKISGSISLEESNKVISAATPPPVFFTTSINGTIGKLNVNLYPTTAGATPLDGVTVRLNNDYERSALEPYDAPKLNNLSENLSIVRDGRYLGIESRPYPTASDSIFLPFWNLGIKDYLLKINATDLGVQLESAILKDRYTQQSTPLNLTGASNDYGFSITPDANSSRLDRFYVVLKNTTVLPLSITKLSAQANTAGIGVSWQTTNEINLHDFDVERSTDGVSFKKMGNVSANGNAVNDYQLLDNQPATGWNYYRLRSNDANGQFSYSATVKALWKATASIRVYPTITKDGKIQLVLQDQPAGDYQVLLSNIAGQVMNKQMVTHSGATARYQLQLQKAGKKLLAGEYALTLYFGKALTHTQKIIVQ